MKIAATFVLIFFLSMELRTVAAGTVIGAGFGFLADEHAPEEMRSGSRSRPAAAANARRPSANAAIDPDTYLERFGYLSAPRNGQPHSPASRRQAIIEFQRMAGLRQSGRLDSATRRKMDAPRCGLPDRMPSDADVSGGGGRSRDSPQGYYVPGYKWSKTSLSWRAKSYSRDLPTGSQRRAFTNAFRYWSNVTPLRFSESSSRDVDIEIGFGSYNHGDGYPFDGEGRTLAHAFYPENGDTHFDESETWTENVDRGTNLEIVAAHEFGHALGLGHSDVQEALMAPFYAGYDPNFRLHSDDIAAIQSLYGPREREPPVRPTQAPDRPSSSKPDTCTTKFDAVFQGSDGIVHVFKHKWMWKLHYWGVYSGYPVLARNHFDRLPSTLGAAVHSFRTRYTYFFKGKYVYQYYGSQRVRRGEIRVSGYQTPQSAFMAGDGKIYLLKGAYYWAFDEGRLTVVSTRSRISSKWSGAPDNVDAAVRLNDGYIYFFKGSRYRKYNEATRRMESGYPKNKAGPWMGPSCNGGRYERK